MKIVYCINSVYLPGGMEKVTIVKANALARIPGNEVWIVVTDAQKEPVAPLERVHLVNLNVRYYDLNVGLLKYLKKTRLHKKRLTEYLNIIKPDVVIATGQSEKNVVPSLKILSNPILILELHFEKQFRMKENLHGLRSRLLARGANFYDNHRRLNRYDHIVILTKEDLQRNWNGWKNVSVIPNPLTSIIEKKSACDTRIAIAMGRLVFQKDFASLVRIWEKVALKHPEWRLEIWGEGEMRQSLQQQIEEADLKDKVFLKGYTSEPLKTMSQSSLFLLSSKYEGLPLVIIEAMSVGLPIVSYMCPTGPQDVLDDGRTGYLVPQGEEDVFAEKVCAIIENDTLRKAMGRAALEESKKYAVENIAPRWMTLFQELLKHKRKKGKMRSIINDREKLAP